MNRWEEIKTAALDVAQHVTQDPAQREAMAGDLITLIGLIVGAVGKGVAVEGEGELSRIRGWIRPTNESPEDAAEFDAKQATESVKAHNRYLLGEQVQTQVDHVVREAKDAESDRYALPAPGVTPDGSRCRHCNRHAQFGHMFGCPLRVSAGAAVPRCPECFRAEGDGHIRGCRQAGTVVVHVAHDLDVDAGSICGCGDEDCDGGCRTII